ncbi:Hypp3077 [Branchiostoma lanceolatum]|uniref:Hypp3077 protein n=1 Tax=Branchiostoma lanceolatum TaxID=7740 RepID=A0A8J9ZZ09_BRALA|nr:Hypp3077 [Branchiostoma lanceolatum]
MAAAAGVRERLYGTIYGQCIGDAVGLLTEFMTKKQAAQVYPDPLEYHMKVADGHRDSWAVGDWTDDSDQMILIMQTLANSKGKVDKSTVCDFAQRLYRWTVEGFPELGDKGGCVLEQTTQRVLKQKSFTQNPHYAALQVWQKSGETSAPNGAVMRTSILGVHNYKGLQTVINNTRAFCLTTHADPRCVASCVAVTTAIAMMLQGWRDVSAIARESFELAQAQLPAGNDAMRQELMTCMQVRDLRTLHLDETDTVGYTYKALGAGFWALRQRSFRDTIIQIAMEGGNAATNSAVAGALLGCRLGRDKLRGPWLYGLRHKHWLDDQIQTYLRAVNFLSMSLGGAKRQKQPPEVDQWLMDIMDRERRDKDGGNEQTDREPHEMGTKSSGKNELPPSSGRPQMIIGPPAENQNDEDSPSPDLEILSLERVSTTEWDGDGRSSSERQKGPVGQQLRISPLGRYGTDGRTESRSDGGQRVRNRYTDGKPTGPRLGPLEEYTSRVRPGNLEKRTTSDFSYTRRPALTERIASPQDRTSSQYRKGSLSREVNQYRKLRNIPGQNFDESEESITMRPRRVASPPYSRQSSPLVEDVRATGNLSRHTRHSLPSDLKSLLEQSEEGVHKLNLTRMNGEEHGRNVQRSSSLPTDREYASDTAKTGLERLKHFHPSLSLSSSYPGQETDRRRARSDDVYVRQGRTVPYTRSVSPVRHVSFSSHR